MSTHGGIEVLAAGGGNPLGGAGQTVAGGALLTLLLGAARLLFSGLRYKDREVVRLNRQLQWERDREHKRAEWERQRGDYWMARGLLPEHPDNWPPQPPEWVEPEQPAELAQADFGEGGERTKRWRR